MPAGQNVQLLAPLPLLYTPVPHAVHNTAPEPEEKVPGPHGRQADKASVPAEYVPVPHKVQLAAESAPVPV